MYVEYIRQDSSGPVLGRHAPNLHFRMLEILGISTRTFGEGALLASTAVVPNAKQRLRLWGRGTLVNGTIDPRERKLLAQPTNETMLQTIRSPFPQLRKERSGPQIERIIRRIVFPLLFPGP